MKLLVVILIVGAVIWLVATFIRSQIVSQVPTFVKREQIPSFVSELRKKGRDGSFVVFMFPLPGNHDEVFPNLQYSIENGRLGFDWVLTAPQNSKDESKVEDFIKDLGYSVTKREMNKVRYLRVEGKGIDDLGIKILRDCYHLAPDAKLELIIQGFDLND